MRTARQPAPLASLRTALVAPAVIAGLVASAASAPVDRADVTGAAGPFQVRLDENAPEAFLKVDAELDLESVLEAGSGEVRLTVDFPSGSVGQVLCGLASLTTGAATDTDVFDPDGQSSVSIAIGAFGGCEGPGFCGEDFEVRFERLEAEVTNPLTLEWTIEGFVSTLEDDAGASGGTLVFTVEI
jgi:hypothetical protein